MKQTRTRESLGEGSRVETRRNDKNKWEKGGTVEVDRRERIIVRGR